MKVTQEREVSSNVSGSVDFSVSADSSKLFSMLSSALYTDKEKAICYEIGANCYDANPNKAFKVVAPTRLEPFVKFRDYGPGLSEDDVYRLLTVYGASEKSTDNSVIGGYGIGAKSPAAVTDTWTVTSHFENRGQEYLVFINEEGIPSLTKVREFDTDETGLEVSIPVESHRFSTWNKNIGRVYKHYPIKPEYVNVNDYDIEELPNECVLSGDGWKLYKNTSYYNRDKCKFITTHREYTPDYDKLIQEFGDDVKLQAALQMNLVVDFEIGDIQLSLSRENIQYTKKTNTAIKKRLTQIMDEIADLLKSKIGEHENSFDFRVFINDIHEEYNGVFTTSELSDYFFTFVAPNDYNIRSFDDVRMYNITMDGQKIMDFLREYKPTLYYAPNESVRRYTDNKNTHSGITVRGDYRDNYVPKVSLPISVFVHMMIVIADVNDVYARLRNPENNPDGKSAFVIRKNIFPKELSEYVVYASDMKKKKRVKGSAKKKDSDVRYYGLGNRNFFECGNLKDCDKKSDIVYLTFTDVRTQNSIIGDYSTRVLESLKEQGWIVRALKANKEGIIEYDIPKNFCTLEQAAKKQFHRMVNAKNRAEIEYNLFRNELNRWECRVIDSLKDFRTKVSSVWNDAMNMIQKVLDDGKNFDVVPSYKVERNLATIRTFEKFLDRKQGFNPTEKFESLKEMIYNEYKMLKYVQYNSSAVDDLKDYIELVSDK